MHQWLKYEIWPERRYLMEDSVTEGQQNYIQPKQCLVFCLLYIALEIQIQIW